MIGDTPAQRYNVSLPPEVAEALRKAGDGNMSAGVRLAAKLLPRKTAGAAAQCLDEMADEIERLRAFRAFFIDRCEHLDKDCSGQATHAVAGQVDQGVGRLESEGTKG